MLHRVLNPHALATVAPLLAEPGAGRAVCFDADGTLWRGDVGEELLRFLAAEDRLPSHRGERDVYARYERIHDVDPPEAYAFAVAVMAGLTDAGLRAQCDAFFARRFAGRLFPFTRPLLAAFSAQGYVPWLVSASPRWIVEAGAAALGVTHVIAVDAELEGGTLTDRVKRPVPAGQGKVELLRAAGVQPAFAAGNGALDQPMLELAPVRLVVAPHDDPGNALVRVAEARGWAVQRG